MATFNETRAQTSRKYISKQGVVMLNWLEMIETFRSHSFGLPLEKEVRNLNFESFFTSNRPFGGYFQWNACTDFQKICSWTRYSDAKFIKKLSNFLVTLLRFCYRKLPKNLNFQSLFYPFVATFSARHAPTSKKYVEELGIVIPNWPKIIQIFWSHSSIFALEKQPKHPILQSLFCV